MVFDKLNLLEVRVRELVELAQALKRENAELKAELQQARERLREWEAADARWAAERADIKARIEKILSELDALEFAEGVPLKP
jgi:predicted nuclease with TOPRIM domain